MWEWTEGVRNGPIRLSHLITTVATTTLLHYLRYLGPLPASLYRIYLGEELEPRHKGLLEEGGFEMILSDLHPLPLPLLLPIPPLPIDGTPLYI